MNATPYAPRIPWIALAMSFLASGLGHIYCGRMAKGLILFCAWLLVPLLAIAAAFSAPSNGVLVGLVLAPTVGMVCLYLYAAIDAFLIARSIGSDYVPVDYNRGVVYVLLIAVGLIYPIGLTKVVKEFMFEAFYVDAGSMRPNILPGDRILVNKIAGRNCYPRRGDVVAFHNPGPGAKIYIKRVLAFAGDTVELQDDQVLINGEPLPRERVPLESLSAIKSHLRGKVWYESNSAARYVVMYADGHKLSDRALAYREFPRTTVPPHCIFVVGDDRDGSQDSRKFGFIPVGDVIGHVQYIYWPAESWTRFGVYVDPP